MTFTHILTPIDFSTPSHEALAYACQEAELHQASLTLIHVLPQSTATHVYYPRGSSADSRGFTVEGVAVPVPPAPEPVSVRQDEGEEALQRLGDLVPSSFAGTWHTKLASGDPADAIVQEAREQEVDLIVMSTHGRTGLAHLLLGSVAEKVMRHASCPVMVTRFRPTAS